MKSWQSPPRFSVTYNMAFRSFDPSAPMSITQQHLPHWRQQGTTYLVTSRLADSMPRAVVERWQEQRDEWLRQHGADSLEELADEWRLDYQRQFTDRFHELLDASHGACLLARRECADILIGKMIEGHSTCFDLGPWCVMPNHFHALITPAPGSVLGEIVQHWKGGSSFAINRLLGRSGRLWMSEPFDHIVRSWDQWKRLGKYVAENPRQAGLHEGCILGYGAEVDLTEEDVKRRIESTSGL